MSRDSGEEGSEKKKPETQEKRRLAFIEKGLAFTEIQRRDHKEKPLFSHRYVPGTVLGTLYALAHVSLKKALLLNSYSSSEE